MNSLKLFQSDEAKIKDGRYDHFIFDRREFKRDSIVVHGCH
jgi:hypothetical protein